MKKKKLKTKGIAATLSLIIALSIFTIIFVFIVLFYRAIKKEFIQINSDRISETVRIAADHVDGEKLAKIIETGQKDDYYKEVKEYLSDIKNNVDDITFIYIVEPHEDYWIYLVEGEATRDDKSMISNLGDIYQYSETEFNCFYPDVVAKKPSTEPIIGDYFEELDSYPLSAWAPVFDDDGELVAMVESDINIKDVYVSMRKICLSLGSILLVGLLILLAFILRFVEAIVAYPLEKLTNYVDSYQDGKFTKNFSYKRNDEIKNLADSFDAMDGRIKDYIERLNAATKESERLNAELNIAKTIQSSALPSIFPKFANKKEYTIAALMDPAKEVGGDFYDFFMIDDSHMAIVIADVSGKGVPGALFMMISKTHIKNQTVHTMSPAEVLELANNQLCETNEAEMFVTVWLGILDLNTGVLTAANAGHEYPAIKRANGRFEIFKDKHGFVVAGMPDMKYKEYEIKLNPGDTIFVYTDGVAEATNSENELFGLERTIEALNSDLNADPEGIIANVSKGISDFVKEAPQFDDITMLCLEYHGI